MKLYWMISQGIAINVTSSKEEALSIIEHENKVDEDYLDYCIENGELYVDTSITIYEVELNVEDEFEIFGDVYTVKAISSVLDDTPDHIVIRATDCHGDECLITSEETTFLHVYPVDNSKVKEITP